MSQGTGKPGGAAASDIRWDMAAAKHHVSDVASALPGADDVIVNFGLTCAAEEADGAVSVRLTRRISMQPQTARRFRDLLRNVIADADAATAKNRT